MKQRMRSSRLFGPLIGSLTGSLLALLACSGAPAPSAPASPALAGTDGAGPSSSSPAPQQAATDLPASPFAGVPGWLGLTVQPAAQRRHGWSPDHPNASVVIMNADAWSETVEEGTRFRLVAQEGNLPLVLSEVSQIPYGCDGTPTTMAAFRTPHDLAEQVAWILPDGHDTAVVVPISAGPGRARQRTWTAGPLTILLHQQDQHGGRLEVRASSGATSERPFMSADMGGDEAAVVDIANEHSIAVPFPAAAFRLDDGTVLLVLRALSYEGVHFEVLALRDGKLASAGKDYVYLCAY